MITKEFKARNYIRHFSYNGPDYIYDAIDLDEQVNKYLKENPTLRIVSVNSMGGDLNKPDGERYLVVFEESQNERKTNLVTK